MQISVQNEFSTDAKTHEIHESLYPQKLIPIQYGAHCKYIPRTLQGTKFSMIIPFQLNPNKFSRYCTYNNLRIGQNP